MLPRTQTDFSIFLQSKVQMMCINIYILYVQYNGQRWAKKKQSMCVKNVGKFVFYSLENSAPFEVEFFSSGLHL